MYRRRNRFRRPGSPRSAVVQQSTTPTRRATTCKACAVSIAKGDVAVRLRLKKHLRVPCATCGHKLLGVRWYHPTCVPADINAAMGYVPSAQTDPVHTYQAPAPPKPKTAQDAALEALDALEKALALKLSRMTITPELEREWRKYQGIKSRVLRPTTEEEGATALRLAIARIVPLVF